MMTEEARRVFVVCSDLMFSAGIREAGISQGISLEFINSEENFSEALMKYQPVLFLSDLHHHSLGGEKSGELLKTLRTDPKNKDVYSIAWGKHTEPDLLKSATRAGFDRVMPRSLFVKEMPYLIRRAANRI